MELRSGSATIEKMARVYAALAEQWPSVVVRTLSGRHWMVTFMYSRKKPVK